MGNHPTFQTSAPANARPPAIEAAPLLAQRQGERLPTIHAPLSELLQAPEPEFSHPPYSSQNERELSEHDILQADWRDFACFGFFVAALCLGLYALFLACKLLLPLACKLLLPLAWRELRPLLQWIGGA